MKKLLASVAILSLAACSSPKDSVTSWFGEVGAAVDSQGDFGAATTNNLAIQSGDKSYMIDLANRFADEVPSTINFAFNSSQLDRDARATLRRQADWIKQFPEVRFKVFGHTDAVGSDSYNKRLGMRRARAAVNYLVSQGIGRNRLEAVVSFGETQPIIATQNRERKNRRTVTEVSGFVAAHPNVLDGKYAQVIYREYIASAVPISEAATIESGSE